MLWGEYAETTSVFYGYPVWSIPTFCLFPLFPFNNLDNSRYPLLSPSVIANAEACRDCPGASGMAKMSVMELIVIVLNSGVSPF